MDSRRKSYESETCAHLLIVDLVYILTEMVCFSRIRILVLVFLKFFCTAYEAPRFSCIGYILHKKTSLKPLSNQKSSFKIKQLFSVGATDNEMVE